MEKALDFLQKWSTVVSMVIGCIGGMTGLLLGLVTYQPLATKNYVQGVIDARLKPLQDEIRAANVSESTLDGKVAALTDSTVGFVVIQLSQMKTRLEGLISSGAATESDRQLLATIDRELTKDNAVLMGTGN